MRTFLQLKQFLAGQYLREERSRVVSWDTILSKSILSKASPRRGLGSLLMVHQQEMELRLQQRMVKLWEKLPAEVLHHH